MTGDPQFAMLDEAELEDVARLAVAELAPPLSSRRSKTGKLANASGSHDAVRRAGEAAIAVLEVKSTDRAASVTVSELGKAIETALRKFLGQREVVILHNSKSPKSVVVRKVMERIPSLVEARQQKLTEKNIDALVDAYLPADALASVMPDIEADNARAQAEFLKAHATLTADQVAERAGHSATNRSATANRWKRERKIFAVRAGGREAYPVFQFKDGQPRAALHPALQALQGRSGWQTAFWFITPNSWLGGDTPVERLEDGEALAAAASHEAEAWVG